MKLAIVAILSSSPSPPSPPPQLLLLLLLQLASLASAQKYTADTMIQMLSGGLSLLVGQKYEDGRNSPSWFKEYAMNDTSNDDVTLHTSQEILSRSGFNYENHFSTSDDGYITNLVRIVNPLADQAHLKWPPVMLLQGGITDDAIWLFGSSIQHHPEKWPRSYQEDGPITSWNRSLAMTLANNGYDVWLVGTRGSTKLNRGHVKYKAQLKSLMDDSVQKVKREAETNEVGGGGGGNAMHDMAERLNYWDFSMDELASYELPRQIDKVLHLTGAQNITLVPMSLSTIFGLMVVGEQPTYRARLHNSVVVAPIINNINTNFLVNFLQRTLCKMLPYELGTLLFDEFLFKDWARKMMLQILKPKELRYSLGTAMTNVLAGPSARYQTLLEPAVLGHLYKQTAFKEGKHWCQQVTAGRLQRFDYGPKKNHKLYGSLRPPAYDLSEADYGDWLVVSAGNDKLATMPSVEQYIRSVRRPPSVRVHVEQYNHLDVWAALDNDVLINLPILQFLDERHYRITGGGRVASEPLVAQSLNKSQKQQQQQQQQQQKQQQQPATIASAPNISRNELNSNEPFRSSSLSKHSLGHD